MLLALKHFLYLRRCNLIIVDLTQTQDLVFLQLGVWEPFGEHLGGCVVLGQSSHRVIGCEALN